MNKYKELYSKGASSQELDNIKSQLSKESFISWEDYIWAAKCIFEYDEEDCDANLLINAVNNAIKYGLSYRSNSQLYTDGLKILAVLYGQFGKYELVVNQLLSFVMLDPNAPDWAFQDLFAAQIHTNEIFRIMEYPQPFMDDLLRNDGTNEFVQDKQRSIFKDFILEASKHIKNNGELSVDYATIEKTALDLHFESTDIWRTFADITGHSVTITPKAINDTDSTESSTSGQDKYDKPIFIPLEDEPSDATKDTCVEDSVKAKLDELSKRLDKTNAELEVVKSQNEDLDNTIQEKDRQLEAIQTQLDEKNAEVAQLQEDAKAGRLNSDELTTAKARVEKEKKDIQNKYNATSTELGNLRNKYKDMQEKLEAAQRENDKNLKEIERLKASAEDKITESYVYGQVSSILNVTVAQNLSSWLRNILPKISQNWMNDCVKSRLKPEQLMRANDEGCSELEDFDLSILLRITSKNWHDICQCEYHGPNEKVALDRMFDIRNDWAHYKQSKFSKRLTVDYLDVIKSFLSSIKARTDVINEINHFSRAVANSKLA